MTVSELSQYAVSQVAMNAMPPLPAAWGDGWLDALARAARGDAGLAVRVGAPAARRAVLAPRARSRPDYGRIEAAVLRIAGWMDEYVDAAIRMQARCTNAAGRADDRRAVGPRLPELSLPGAEHRLAARDGPLVRPLAQGRAERRRRRAATDLVPPRARRRRSGFRSGSTGRGGPPAWPPVARRAFADSRSMPARCAPAATLGRRRHLRAQADRGRARRLAVLGRRASAERPRRATSGSRTTPGRPTSPSPSTEPLDILGMPVAVLHVSATRPVAHLVVRLGDVAPDGAIEQVSEGILNLTHRDSHADPTPLEPGRRYEVRVPLRAAGYRFPAGHRVYLGIASAHWPVIWPSPGAGELSIHRGPSAPSRLELPLAPTGGDAVEPPAFRAEAPHLVEIGSETSDPATWETVEEADGSITIRTHEAATSVLPDGVSTLLRRRDPGDDRVGARAGSRPIRERVRVPPRSRRSEGRDRRGRHDRRHGRRHSRWTSRSGSTSTASGSSSGPGAR